ncbi:MAG TPA: hypothetical protein VFQ65_01930 [Kofleriaceae bacterium]|nr:hypothetical protein [Kofleriaceae bacterium]
MADRRFTDLELERSLAGDLSPARAAALAAEATGADKERLAELERGQAEYLRDVDVDAEVRRIEQRAERYKPEPRRGWLRWFLPLGTLVAAAAALVLFLQSKKPAPRTDDGDDFRTKGDDVSLVIHSEAHQLANGDSVTPGTKIRFEAQGGKPGFIAIVGIDGAHATTVYYPYGAREATAIGKERLLPGAIQLDATPGDETFFALFSTKPFPIDAVLPAVTGAGTLPPGIAMSRVVLHKK